MDTQIPILDMLARLLVATGLALFWPLCSLF